MSGGTKKEREERAVDALLVSALRQTDKDEDDIDPKRLPKLTDEEKAAMNGLGDDFITRLLAGERPLGDAAAPETIVPDECGEEELATAGCGADGIMYRAEEVDEQTKQELDEQEREILERRARERKERGGGDNP